MAAISNEGVPAPHSGEPSGDSPRQGDSWFDRLRQRLGFRGAATARDELEEALDESETGGGIGFTPEERLMLRNILDLRELRVEDVMVPRADIEAIAADTTLGNALVEFEQAGHSRLPVYEETLDAPLGMVHIKDIMGILTRQAMVSAVEDPILDLGRLTLSAPLSSLEVVRPVLFVPTSMPAADLLVSMQAKRVHMALVIDEHGGTDGLVTIEDLVELVVGDIEDEHDEEDGPAIGQIADGSFVADARVGLEEVMTLLGEEFEVGEAIEEVDTLGGFIVTLLGRVPREGERVQGPGSFVFEILEADPARLRRIRIERTHADDTNGDGQETRPPAAGEGSGRSAAAL